MSHHQIRWLFTLIIIIFHCNKVKLKVQATRSPVNNNNNKNVIENQLTLPGQTERTSIQVHQQSDNKSWSRSIKNETQFNVSAQLTITLQYTVQQCAVSVGDTAVRLIIRFRWQINSYRIALTMLTMLTVLEVDKPRFLSLVWHSNEDKQLNIYLSYESKEKLIRVALWTCSLQIYCGYIAYIAVGACRP